MNVDKEFVNIWHVNVTEKWYYWRDDWIDDLYYFNFIT